MGGEDAEIIPFGGKGKEEPTETGKLGGKFEKANNPG